MLSGVSGFPSAYANFPAAGGEKALARPEAGTGAPSGVGKTLSEAEQRQVAELQQVDRKVRQHEQMHVATGGELVISGPSYSYTKGPDGKSYATAGEVGIDTSKARTPEETVTKARRIRATALAPPDPSPQDRQVAALAAQMEMQAMQEVARQRLEAGKTGAEDGGAKAGTTQTRQSFRVREALQAYAGLERNGEAQGGGRVSLYA